VTTNGGRNWTLARGNLPRVPIDDIVFNEKANDLVLGTHGRSIIILDDVSPFEHLTPAVMTSDAHLFPLRPATQYYEMRMLPTPGASEFAGPNPPYGALITYYLRDDPKSQAPRTTTTTNGTNGGSTAGAAPAPEPAAPPTVTITVVAPDGSVVRELSGPDRKGLQRVNWDLRYPLTFTPTSGDEGWFGPPKGTFVLPGQYTLKLSARGREMTQPLVVRVDPRAQTSQEALAARFRASQAVADLQRAFTESAAVIQAMTTELDGVNARMKEPGANKAAAEGPVKEFTKKLDDLKEKFKPGWGGPKFLIFDLAGQLQASTSAPTEAQLRAIDQLTARLTTDIEGLNAFTSRDLPEFRTRVASAGLAAPAAKTVTPPKRP
jgi:hypothetical protein